MFIFFVFNAARGLGTSFFTAIERFCECFITDWDQWNFTRCWFLFIPSAFLLPFSAYKLLCTPTEILKCGWRNQ